MLTIHVNCITDYMTPNYPAPRFAFGPRNYRLMWIGLAVLAAGFITMMFATRKTTAKDFLGITLGPLLLIAGFVIEFAAIMVRDKSLASAPRRAAATARPGRC